MKIALVCTGLGRVRRGFESFTESLFHQLREACPQLDVVLFKSAGEVEDRQRVIHNWHRNDAPARWLRPDRALRVETRSFALCLFPELLARGFDLVHYNELTFGSALWHLRRFSGGRYRLLYCNGAPSPPSHYHHRCDMVQNLSPPMHEAALAFGIDPGRLALLPYGVDNQQFRPASASQRERARRALAVPASAFVVLCVAAIKREHKRINYLIEQVGLLSDRAWLVVAGEQTADTRGLARLAQERLPGRWQFLSHPYGDMSQLYAAADAFVLPSLSEGLGLALLEAMACGLPVLCHNSPLFRWVTTSSAARLLDMTVAGTLVRELRQILKIGLAKCEGGRNRAAVLERFAWPVLLPRYLELYRRTCMPAWCNDPRSGGPARAGNGKLGSRAHQ